jgi:hypothetical protein
MEIHYSIVSSDDSHYLDYWTTIKQAWFDIGITPVLVKIATDEEINKFKWKDTDGLCVEHCLEIDDELIERSQTIYLRQIPGIKSSLQAQIARLWAYKLLDGNCIMSDIDMLPISGNYFHSIAENGNEDEILSYCADAADKFDGNHPMCYILANNAVMSSLIKFDTWEDFCKTLAAAGGQGWSTDQWYLTQILNDYHKTISLQRGWNSAGCAYNRLDRIGWNYDVSKAKNFYDAHLPRPYKGNEEIIKKLVDAIK